MPKYFSSEWSFAQFHLPEVTRYIVAFGAQNTVMMVGLDGRYSPHRIDFYFQDFPFSKFLHFQCLLLPNLSPPEFVLVFFQKEFVLAKGRHKWKYKLYTFFVLDQDIIALVTSIVACPVYELCML